MHHLYHLSVVIDMGVDILEEFSLGMLEMEVQISGGNDQLHMGHFHNSIKVYIKYTSKTISLTFTYQFHMRTKRR